MLTCIFNGEELTYYDFVGKFDSIDDAKIQLKRYSADKKLKCKGCGKTVFFVDSEKRIKHFRHKRGNVCSYLRFAEAQTSFEVIKEMLYSVLKIQEVLSDVELDKKIADDLWADIHASLRGGGELVVNFIKRSFKDLKLVERHRFFRKKGIKDIWIILGEPSIMNNKTDMYTKDSLMLSDGWQGVGLYCSEDSNSITVRAKYDGADNYFNSIIDIHDFSIDESGNLSFINGILSQHRNEEKMLGRSKELEVPLSSEKADPSVIQNNNLEKIAQFHAKAGKFADGYIGNSYIEIDLKDIKGAKDTSVTIKSYTENDFNKDLNRAFLGDAKAVRALINKLYRASDDEKEIYDKLMENYRTLPKDDEKYQILSHISKESGFIKYITNKRKFD